MTNADKDAKRRPTIDDVARLANVSRSLVSLVLREPQRVSERRRRAVQKAVRDLGYRPNAAARNLAARRTNMLGVIVSDLHNPFYTDVLDGIAETAEDLGQQVLIASGDRNPSKERAAADAFVELRVDGVILITPTLSTEDIETVAVLVPTVIVGRPGNSASGTSQVYTDDDRGIRAAIDHLVELGHRDIAFVAAGENPGARARLAAYGRIMSSLGLPERSVAAAPTQDGGYHAAQELLSDASRPTAIATSNDLAAVGVLGAIGDAGLSCPDDVSVVGYDNTILAELPPIQLTTVNQPRRLMGRTAAQLLRDRMKSDENAAVSLEPRLVVRLTTAPPPATFRPSSPPPLRNA